MIKTLLKKQIREMGAFLYQSSKAGKRRSKAALIGYIALLVYAFGALGVMFFIMGLGLCEPLVSLGFGWLYFALMGTLSTILGVVGSVFTAYSGLYQAKDNELLLSMPIPPSQILLVRMVGIYIMSFLFEAIAMVPTLIVYFLYGNPSVLAVIFGIFILFILPLFALTVSCILGWLIGLVSAYIKGRGKNLVTVILSLVFIAVYYYFCMQAYNYLQLILINAEQISGIMKTVLFPMYQMGLAAEGNMVSLLCFVVISFGIFGLMYFILSRSFLKIATTKQGTAKVQYKEKEMKAGTKSQALLYREFLHFTGNAAYMLNCGLGTIVLLITGVAVFIKADWVLDLISQMKMQMPDFEQYLPLIVVAIPAFSITMNDITAPSISLEGKNIWIVQSMPVSAWEVLKSKLMLHLLFTLPPAIFCTICVEIVLKPEMVSAVLILLFVILFSLLTAMLGLFINLKIPNLNWTNETVAIKQSMGVMLALFGSWAILFSLGGLYFAVKNVISAVLYLFCSTLLAGVICIVLMKWLKTKGAEIFESL